MRDRPHPQHKLEWPGGVVPEWARPAQNNRRRGKNAGGKGAKRERLQKVMAQSGYGSRRNIEILIAQGHLTVNGQLAKLGDSVGPGDKVKLDGNLIHLRFGDPLPRVLIYHKPEGEIVTRDDPEKRATVFDKLPKVNGGRWVSVGRLDLNTGGLLLFTTSGELANRMTHPRFEVEREYAVRVMGELTEEHREKLLRTGVDIDGDNCTFDSIEDRGGEGSNHWYHVVLREGKNREVRRMMEAVGLMVSRLMRVRFGNVELPGHVKRGMFREMEEEQVQELLAFAGMNQPPPGEEASEEDDERENIGNRIDTGREARAPREPDDDIGNRYHPPSARAHHEPDGNRPHPVREHSHEPDGNRMPEGRAAVEGNAPRPQRPPRAGQKPRPQGGKPFFKKRGPGGPPPLHAEGGPPPAPGQGQPQRKRRKHGKGKGPGPQGGQPGAAQAQGHRPPGPPQAGAPGAAGPKPGRNRNRNRNRKRGAPGGGGGEQPPASNANRETP